MENRISICQTQRDKIPPDSPKRKESFEESHLLTSCLQNQLQPGLGLFSRSLQERMDQLTPGWTFHGTSPPSESSCLLQPQEFQTGNTEGRIIQEIFTTDPKGGCGTVTSPRPAPLPALQPQILPGSGVTPSHTAPQNAPKLGLT